MRAGMDAVFRALGDPTRRRLLDQLHERNGQTLGELCVSAGMARQSVTQHLDVLAAANLVSTTRRGREKLHYLNPVPLHDIQDRWIEKFERPRLRALGDLRRRAEDDMTDPSFGYVTYIESSPERVWHALTDPDTTAAYWGHRNISDWRTGSRWEHARADGSGLTDGGGTVQESTPPSRLVLSWTPPTGEPGPVSRVAFDIEPWEGLVRLTVTHTDLPDDAMRADVGAGWSAVISNLKSLLETGHVLPRAPWEMAPS